ncbi:GFA family protein [Roseovarius aestuariivivens]|uniref:GFA family protein n=1 Tax=Roseovarius aestuariivivens TaxID=1888910 RepID=UPI001FD8DD49|nr:GFA family protein [Roseovarius aestuariivivens]
MLKAIEGQCLCGAVKVSAKTEEPKLSACHCDMCRRHTSGMFISVDTVSDSVTVDGPATSFRSSEWAERGFCTICGSTLWYGTVADNVRHLAAGLFPDAAGGEIKIEFFADMCPKGYQLAGAHRKLTTDETIAMFTSDEGEAS